MEFPCLNIVNFFGYKVGVILLFFILSTVALMFSYYVFCCDLLSGPSPFKAM